MIFSVWLTYVPGPGTIETEFFCGVNLAPIEYIGDFYEINPTLASWEPGPGTECKNFILSSKFSFYPIWNFGFSRFSNAFDLIS